MKKYAPPCLNCKRPFAEHTVGKKCLFQPTQYRPLSRMDFDRALFCMEWKRQGELSRGVWTSALLTLQSICQHFPDPSGYCIHCDFLCPTTEDDDE